MLVARRTPTNYPNAIQRGHRTDSHSASGSLAQLGVDKKAFVSFVMHNEVDLQFAPRDFGAVTRPLPVYPGVTRAHGQWRYTAPGLGPLDMYAGVTQSMFEQGAAP